MKSNIKTESTRGKWKKRELVMAVLLVLKVAQQQDIPGLAAQMIYEYTGCNHNSLYCHLGKWVRYEYITRKRVGGLYYYSIALKGNSYFEALTQGFLSTRKRKFIQFDTSALLKRLPLYQRSMAK